jgi:mannosyl-oligosaccharide alpha-1,2-mannosidase
MGLLPVSVPARSRTRPGSSSSSSTAAAAAAAALVGSSSVRSIQVRPRLALVCCGLMLLLIAVALWAGGGPVAPAVSANGNQKMTVREGAAADPPVPAPFPAGPPVTESRNPPTIPIEQQKLQQPQPEMPPEQRPQEQQPSAGSESASAADSDALARLRQDDVADSEYLSAELNRERANAVRAEIQFAWQQYKKYAWGFDELNPLARVGKNWIGTGMGATIVDALDTLWLAELRDEYAEARDFMVGFDLDKVDGTVSTFETTIRSLGGLLSAHALTGDEALKDKALDLARRLLRAFDGGEFPYAAVRIAGAREGSFPGYTGGRCCLSEVGTLQMEFFYAALIADDPTLSRQVARIIDILDSKKMPDALWPVYVAANNVPESGRSTLGALGDSFYEYLLKVWLQSGGRLTKYRRMYTQAVDAIAQYMIGRTASGLTYFAELADTRSKLQVPKMDHLACFGAGMLALGGHSKVHEDAEKNARDIDLGERILNSCHEGYLRMGTSIGPEIMEFNPRVLGNPSAELNAAPGARHYLLRPETVESYFVLWRMTRDPKYRRWGWEAFEAIRRVCRSPSGYSGIRDVTVSRISEIIRDDTQQSFLFAETFKYLYLLFADDSLLPLDDWVLNTEAHPLPVWKSVPEDKLRELIPHGMES